MISVLVIDDEECIREVICDVLENPDCRVLQAASADSGLELARSQMPDMILLDYRLPGTDGIQVLAKLKQGSTAHIPVILMSGSDADEMLYRVVLASSAGYLLKPFGCTDLLLKIREVMNAPSDGAFKKSPAEKAAKAA